MCIDKFPKKAWCGPQNLGEVEKSLFQINTDVEDEIRDHCS